MNKDENATENKSDVRSKFTISIPGNLFIHTNSPLPGWTKEVMVKNNKGSLAVKFVPPDEDHVRICKESDLLDYLAKQKLPLSMGKFFDFRSVYCVCHQPQDDRRYAKCSHGTAGCHGWVHPECVGIYCTSKIQLKNFPQIVCPLCAHFLQSVGLSRSPQKSKFQ